MVSDHKKKKKKTRNMYNESFKVEKTLDTNVYVFN